MEKQRGEIDPGLAVAIGLGVALFSVFALMFGAAAYSTQIRADCVKANTHRSAADVQVVCGRA
jgi:hypothetical protein